MNLPCTSARDAAEQLVDDAFKGFKAMPYNRRRPDETSYWWIVPKIVKPAFQFGKVLLSTDERWFQPDSVFVGFVVEKGYEKGHPKTREVMKPNWFWNEFVRLANEPLARAVEQASKAIGGPVQVQVDAAKEGAEAARVLFESTGKAFTQTDYRPGDGILSKLAASTTFADLAEALNALNGSPTHWYWLNVAVGSTFTLDPAGADDTPKCAAMLEPFRDWMRTARKI